MNIRIRNALFGLMSGLALLLGLGTPAVAQVDSTSLKFERQGNAEYVALPHFDSPAYVGLKQMTISAWIKISDQNIDPTGTIVAWSQSHNPFLEARVNAGKLLLVERTPFYVNRPAALMSGTIATCVWTHVAFTFNNGRLRYYINGALDTQTTLSLTNFANSYNKLSIAANVRFGTALVLYDGSQQEVSIWNKELDETAIAGLLDGIESTDLDYVNLLGYWQMNDGSGQIVTDSSTYGRDGTLGQTAVAASDDPAWVATSTPVCANENTPPTADAGADQAIRAGDTVNLIGSGFDDNTDPENLVYSWTFSSIPIGSAAVLANADTSIPSFTADLVGTYLVDLVVTDEGGFVSAVDSVEVSTLNLAPTSVATADTALAILDQTVGFDGSGSSDPEGDPLSYAWTTTMQPVGSTATLTGTNTVSPTLVPDLEGDYEVTLTVSDFLGAGTSASAGFTAITASGYAELQILDACALTEGLAANQVKSKGNQKAFCNHLRNAIKDLQKGKTSHAIETLEKAIERTDGCPERGLPDGNGSGMDWIIDCDAQIVVYGYLTSSIAALEL